MNTLALLGVLLFAGVDIGIAPDQPLPYVYMDDPVILEVRSDDDMDAAADIRVQARHHDEPVDLRLEGLKLRAQGSRWVPLEAFPAERGFYAAHVVVSGTVASSEKDLLFCRVDRPVAQGKLPLLARSGAWDEKTLLALRNAGVSEVGVDLDSPGYAAQMALAKAMRFGMVPRLRMADPAQLEQAIALVATLHQKYCGSIVRWELSCESPAEQLPAIAEALHRSGCPARVTVVVGGASEVAALLDGQLLKHLDGLVLASDGSLATERDAVLRTLASAGYERIPVHGDGAGLPEGTRREGPALVRGVLEQLAAGEASVAFDASLVYNGAVQEALPYLAGLSRRLVATQYVGALPSDDGVTALLFMAGARWLIATWSDAGQGTVPVPVEGAGELMLTDALNNPLPLPKATDGAIVLSVGPSPLLLTGSGGQAAGAAALTTAITLTRELVTDTRYAEAGHVYPKKLIERADSLTRKRNLLQQREENSEGGLRALLLDMLREFPAFEYRWQSGETPKGPTLTLVAGFARLVRALCVVEEARAEPFIEPLSDRLASCEELQSLYLTSQTADSPFAERGEQLLAEVRRLMEEARLLEAAGRTIEAHGVAALAEWRARSLNALQEGAPLAPPPPEPVAPVVEETPAEEPAPPKPEEVLEPGQPAGTRKVIHKVASGENPSIISKKYGVKLEDFMEWNKLSKRSILSIDQELKVYVEREYE